MGSGSAMIELLKSAIYNAQLGRHKYRAQYEVNIPRELVAQWATRLTRNGQTRVRIRKATIFDYYTSIKNNFLDIK